MKLLDDDYELQSANSEYIKMPGNGGTLYFAFLPGGICTGWEYWTKDNKPVRKVGKEQFTAEEMTNVRVNDEGTPDKQKHVWWVHSIDLKSGTCGILSISQSKVQKALLEFIRSGDYGDMTDIKVKITGEGDGLKRTYLPAVVNLRGDEITTVAEARELHAAVDVAALMTSDNPTKVDSKTAEVM